jgi:hypothetical protein
VAHPERVKLSLEQEQDALRHQACSTAWPGWRIVRLGAGACFIRHGVGLAGGLDQHRCDRRACAALATVDGEGMCSVADRLVVREESPSSLMTTFTKVNLVAPTCPVISPASLAGKDGPTAWKPHGRHCRPRPQPSSGADASSR